MNNSIETVYRDLAQYKDPAHDLIRTMVMLFENAKITSSKKCFDLGFINSQNVKQNDSIYMRKDYNIFIRKYLEMLGIYGENTIMVTQNEFVDIVNKYDLFCGPFEMYQGEIPSNQIHEIDIANKKLWQGSLVNLHPHKIFCLCDIRFNNHFDEEIYTRLIRFPFYDEDLYYGKPIIAKRHNLNMSIIRQLYYKETKNLFIAAPKSQMGIDRLKKQNNQNRTWYSRMKQEQNWQEDPLICSWIPNIGVIIHTAWGVEANEKLLAMRKVVNLFILDVINKVNPIYAKVYELLK